MGNVVTPKLTNSAKSFQAKTYKYGGSTQNSKTATISDYEIIDYSYLGQDLTQSPQLSESNE